MPSRDNLNVFLMPELMAWIATQVASGRFQDAASGAQSQPMPLAKAER